MIPLDRSKAVLILVDLQEKLLAAIPDSERLLARTETLLRGCQILGVPVIHTEQVPDKLGQTLPAIRSRLDGRPAIPKSVFSCFRQPEFEDQLDASGRSQVVLAGVESHVCVLQTAFDLISEDYAVCVVADAVSSRRVEDLAIALRAMEQAGAYLAGVETVLFQLLGTAEDPAFREIHRLIR
jgi:nicotinamidase-related amidase